MTLALTFALCLIAPSDLVGAWTYDGYIYRDDRYPLPNPNLHLTFTFRDDDQVRLFWTRRDETGFCEREAFYSIENDLLYQKIDWVNPDNRPDCQSDSDMQLGRESLTRVRIVGDELHFILNLDDEDFFYVLKKTTTPRTPKERK